MTLDRDSTLYSHPLPQRILMYFFSLQARGQDVPGETLHEILNEIDLNLNGQVEFDEYLQVTIASFLQHYKFF